MLIDLFLKYPVPCLLGAFVVFFVILLIVHWIQREKMIDDYLKNDPEHLKRQAANKERFLKKIDEMKKKDGENKK